MKRQKKTILLIISDESVPQLDWSLASVCVRAHVIHVMLLGVIFHLYTTPGPFLYTELPPQDFKFMSTTEICYQHFLTIKRTVAGE